MSKCKFCKKELGNKNVVEVCIYGKVEWSKDKELIETGFDGDAFYICKECYRKFKLKQNTEKRG